MRKILLVVFFTAISLISFSCEEDFSPKTPFKEQYVLNCIIRASNTASNIPLIATLYKTYTIDGYDPMDNKTDPAIIGADIKIYHQNKVYTMADTSMPRTDTSRYTTPKTFYAVSGIKFKSGDSVKIVATLKNGVVLSSAVKIPPSFSFTANKYIIDPTEPTKEGNVWRVSWNTSDYSLLFAPKLNLNYYYKENGKDVAYTKVIPLRYSMINNVLSPYFPKMSKGTALEYSFASFDSAMTQISQNVSNKNLFKISYPTFEVTTLEENLASYYSTSNGYMDDVTIRLDEGEYSNIKGGLGIFGASYTSTQTYVFDDSYISGFGYLKFGS